MDYARIIIAIPFYVVAVTLNTIALGLFIIASWIVVDADDEPDIAD